MTPQLPFESDAGASQAQRILEALQSGRRLTCLDILRDFACMNAKGRLFELRRAGHPIVDEWVKTANGARVKRYYLKA